MNGYECIFACVAMICITVIWVIALKGEE